MHRTFFFSSFSHTLGLILNKIPEKVFELLDTMTIQPDAYTLSMIFRACSQVNDERAKKIAYELMDQMRIEFRTDIVLQNSVLSMLMNFHEVGRAEQVFRSMKRRDVISYGAMMDGKYSSYNLYID